MGISIWSRNETSGHAIDLKVITKAQIFVCKSSWSKPRWSHYWINRMWSKSNSCLKFRESIVLSTLGLSEIVEAHFSGVATIASRGQFVLVARQCPFPFRTGSEDISGQNTVLWRWATDPTLLNSYQRIFFSFLAWKLSSRKKVSGYWRH
jgi:hypothetical protein